MGPHWVKEALFEFPGRVQGDNLIEDLYFKMNSEIEAGDNGGNVVYNAHFNTDGTFLGDNRFDTLTFTPVSFIVISKINPNGK